MSLKLIENIYFSRCLCFINIIVFEYCVIEANKILYYLYGKSNGGDFNSTTVYFFPENQSFLNKNWVFIAFLL